MSNRSEQRAEATDTLRLVESLRSAVCPVCGNSKSPRQTMCRADYFALTELSRKALYARIGQGYEDAFADAMAELGVTNIYWPEDVQ